MTYLVSSGALNSTHSFTRWHISYNALSSNVPCRRHGCGKKIRNVIGF